ncbi:sporulation protein YpjB [Desmospora profundinema]|uniref:Sporulation protein YpjB n=1 Tax=Desmospora profundinema TaxID=1571184 RepID=A0ABU1IIG4_9BACL|nr:sporulation protein YpjB [Desmospora profundinema]MDR6224481.1 sporulation protein YpjB [Desmospora profundinema]
MRKGWLVLCGVIWWGWWFGTGSAMAADPEEEWLQDARSIRESVREAEWGQAREKLRILAEEFVATAPEAGWEPTAIAAVSDCVVELDQALNPASLRPLEAWDGAERLWLALDARIHSHQPLWHEYEEVFRQDLSIVQKAIQTGRPAEIRSALDTWSHHMEQIRPALSVSFSDQSVQQLEARMDVSNGDPETVRLQVEEWEKLLPALFGGTEKELLQHFSRSQPPVGQSLLLLGTAIAIVLGYVALLKYRHEQRVLTSRG